MTVRFTRPTRHRIDWQSLYGRIKPYEDALVDTGELAEDNVGVVKSLKLESEYIKGKCWCHHHMFWPAAYTDFIIILLNQILSIRRTGVDMGVYTDRSGSGPASVSPMSLPGPVHLREVHR